MKASYFIKRIVLAIPTFFGITVLVFFLANLTPGSPLDAFLQPGVTEDELERLRISLGLDQPVYMQYFSWLSQLFEGDLGYSYSTSRPVAEMVAERLPNSALLAFASVVLSALIALPFGIMAASKPGAARDKASSFISFVLMATPNFFLGLILIYLISVKLHLLPSSGMYSSTGNKDFLDLLLHMILPCLVLSFQQIGNWFRQMRGSLKEVLQEDFIRTARAKGLSKWHVIRRHGLKNALIPVITVIGMSIPELIGGAVVTEQLFGWQGIGSLLMTAITARDYPVIMGATVTIAIIVLVVNIIVDFLYGLLDPRISYK